MIGDLGLAKKYDQIRSSTQFAGTVNYISPECIENDSILTKSDIWSLGCIVFELVELKKAFNGISDFQIFEKVLKEKIPEVDNEFLDSIIQKYHIFY